MKSKFSFAIFFILTSIITAQPIVAVQLGSDIDGEAGCVDYCQYEPGDESGHSVSLSIDGTIVAIGAPYNDGSG